MADMGMSGGSGGGGANQPTQQYCLKWNNHQNNLLRVFIRLLGQEMFTDVIIASEGKRIKCHKVVLSACSSYFEHLFMSFNEPNQIVILKDTPYEDIVAIVEFMYKGEINVSQDRLSSLLKTAENLKVKGLAEVSGSEEKKPPAAKGLNNNNSSAMNGLHGPTESPSSLQQQRPSLTSRLGGPPPMQMMARHGSGLLADNLMNGDVKRKRGRPRTLDGPEDSIQTSYLTPRIASISGGGITNLNPLLLVSSLASSTPTITTTGVAANRSAEESSSPLKQARLMALAAAAVAGGNSMVSRMPVIKAATPPKSMSPLQAALNRPLNETKTNPSSPKETKASSNPSSTPGSPQRVLNFNQSITNTLIKQERTNENDESASISDSSSDKEVRAVSVGEGGLEGSGVSPERLASWGIIKMNDYLVTGTRQQYWEEFFVKHVMEAVRNKEVDMKGAAEILGVSYGTLYGRYRENFGYLKHAWNLTGRPQRKQNIWTDPSTSSILEAMRSGTMSMKQAAEALGMEPAMLAYHLAAKVDPVPSGGAGGYSDDDFEEEELDDDEDGAGIIIGAHDEPDDDDEVSELMEIQPEIIVGDGVTVNINRKSSNNTQQFESIVEEVD